MRSVLKIFLSASEGVGRVTPAIATYIAAGATRPTMLLLLGLIAVPPSNAEPLGRLFFTPEQRMQLDYAYAGTNAGGQESSSVLIINGIVQKQGGARTVWINGVARDAERSADRTPESQTITVPGKSFPVKAKVGQKILLDQPAPADEKK